MSSPTNIRKGNVIVYQGVPHLVLGVDHRTPGRRVGFVQVTMRNLQKGSSIVAKFKSAEVIEFCHVESKALEFSYVDEGGYHFMHPETFEDTVLPKEVVEEQKDFLVPSNTYEILFVNEKPVQVQLPASVAIKVTRASEGLRGDSASSAQKAVETESGLMIQVPLFIKTGDVIRINTEDKTYLGRA
jgi:elongation factor P